MCYQLISMLFGFRLVQLLNQIIMNGPLIFTIIHIIKVSRESVAAPGEGLLYTILSLIIILWSFWTALKCVEQEMKPNETRSGTDTTEEENLLNLDATDVEKVLQLQCSCPCRGVARAPVCGRTTSGAMRSFDSQCHLICHNQCSISERYAILFHQECPVIPLWNTKNGNPERDGSQISDRRGDASLNTNAFTSLITPLEWECDCAYCAETRWIRLDYYPICAERGGHKFTFESWCHFDCENKCVRHTGYTYLYLYKGNCEEEHTEEVVIPRRITIIDDDPCRLCNAQCSEFFEPVCAKNSKHEYLSFNSRCHMRCHNQCFYNDVSMYFVHYHDGQCSWRQR